MRACARKICARLYTNKKGMSRGKMREKDIEQKLVWGVKKLGGRAYKFVSPGNVGVPDRIIVWPDGNIEFVELKTETGKLSAMQSAQINRLQAMACNVHVLYGSDAVSAYLTAKAANGL